MRRLVVYSTFFGLFFVAVLVFMFSFEKQGEKGKQWCENFIQEYETNREKFIKSCSDDLLFFEDGELRLRPGRALGDGGGPLSLEWTDGGTLYFSNGFLEIRPSRDDQVKGHFRLFKDGEYTCMYSQSGFGFPHTTTYSSKTGEWVYED